MRRLEESAALSPHCLRPAHRCADVEAGNCRGGMKQAIGEMAGAGTQEATREVAGATRALAQGQQQGDILWG